MENNTSKVEVKEDPVERALVLMLAENEGIPTAGLIYEPTHHLPHNIDPHHPNHTPSTLESSHTTFFSR